MTFKGSSKVVYTNACVVFDYFSLVNENTARPVLHPSVSINHTDRLKTSRCHSSSPFCDSVSSFTPSSLSPSLLIPIPILHPDLLTSSTSSSNSSSSQASNGPSIGYAYSLPSTPVVSHRELRVAQGDGGGSVNARSLKSIPRRPSLFKVSHLQLLVSHTF